MSGRAFAIYTIPQAALREAMGWILSIVGKLLLLHQRKREIEAELTIATIKSFARMVSDFVLPSKYDSDIINTCFDNSLPSMEIRLQSYTD